MRMSTKHLEHGVAAWLAVLTVMFVLGTESLFGADLVRQEGGGAQEKKDEKKDEKKEEKKLSLKSARKIEFTTDEGTWISLDVSPDGKTIAFELLGDIYTMPIAGGEAKLIDGGMAFDSQPHYSPDGKWIAFLSDRDGNDNLWYAKADGTEPKQLTRDNRIAFRSPNWTPDSQYAIVTKTQQGTDVWMYHLRGGSGVNITGARG